MIEDYAAVTAAFRPAGMRPMLLAMAETDLRDVLPTIAVPTLLLHGEEDVRSSLAAVCEMHASIPGSTLVVLPAVGHASNLETPSPFNAAVRTFLLTAST